MQKVPFYGEDYVCQASELIAYVMDKQSGTCRRYLLLQGLCVPSVKTTTYACNRFNTSFCTKDHRTQEATFCYTLLHQATRVEEKNSLRERRDLLVSDRDPQRLSSFRLYYIQFKENKILWGAGTGGWGLGAG